MSTEVSVVVASHNTRTWLERCLAALGAAHEVIVVDTGSVDGSQDLVNRSFPHVQLLELDANPGYGGAINAGVGIASGDYLLLMNADAWPVGDAVQDLLQFANREPKAGVIGPLLLNPDGSLQPSVRGFPTLWRLATEYLFLRWLAPRSHALNAFYASRFDHRSRRDAEWVVGAVMFVRRQAMVDVGGFDTRFFMFNEEVDFCYRAKAVGWDVVFWPGAAFVHVGGASTAQMWPRMYREQLRSHLRFLAKHCGVQRAERARVLLIVAMQLRTLVFGITRSSERRRLSRDAATWLASGSVPALLDTT